jgi:hypothetical protein
MSSMLIFVLSLSRLLPLVDIHTLFVCDAILMAKTATLWLIS